MYTTRPACTELKKEGKSHGESSDAGQFSGLVRGRRRFEEIGYGALFLSPPLPPVEQAPKHR